LKTQLSRWENGHALPEPVYRDLLGELYGRTPAELGLVAGPDRTSDGGAGRLRAALAEAAAATRAGPDLWWEQLAAARRLDDELGAAGAGGVVDALVERLTDVLAHTVGPAARRGTAAVLAATAALGAAQSLDRARPDLAWRRYGRSLAAAREADLPVAASTALAGQAEVLVEVAEPATAVALLAEAGAGPQRAARVRLAAAAALAGAAAGDRPAADRALAAAEREWRAGPVDLVHPPDGPAVELADLHRWCGRALVELGDRGAAEPLDRALRAGPRSARDRAAVHADLAVALRPIRPDEAAEHAATARDLAVRIGSERVTARLAGQASP
ncbi:MAG TPA: hypothetical protein VEZ42_12090, partial [Pseudonocardia sp.]|nr:hypothetical protein [Pseudonocardia sp.]